MKTIEEKIAVMQAYADGKTIECYGYSYLNNWTEVENPRWDWWNYDYRVKQEPKKPKYRPYKDAEECFKDVIKHGGWIKDTKYGMYCTIDRIGDIVYYGGLDCTYYYLLTNFIWVDDGTRCGVLEE